MHEYDRLKKLILGNEQQAIKQIESELSQLQKSISDPQEIFNRIVPHFSKLLVNASVQETKKFEKAVISAIDRLLERESEGAYEPVIEKLSPLIYEELRQYVKLKKEDVTDLLYPVVGSMISKYVSQMLQDMMNDVNEKIQHGLSVENIKRKIVAKIKGVDESELLLYEAMPLHVKAVLLIHKQMGAVIAYRVDSDTFINEPEMVASMLTALTDFINNWIDKQEAFNEVNEINYGNSKIYLEASGHSYLAVLIEGQTTQEVVNTTNTVLGNILNKFSSEMQQFDGDLSLLPSDEIHQLFDPLFELNKIHVKEKKPLSKWPLILIASLLVFLFSWWYYIKYDKEQFKQMVLERIHSNEYLTLYAIGASWHDDVLVVDGRLPNSKLKKLILDVVITKKLPYEIQNSVIVVKPLVDYAKSKVMIAKQLALLNSDLHTDLSYEIDNGLVHIYGQTSSREKLQAAIGIIKDLDAIKSVNSDVAIFRPELDNSIYFLKASSVLQENELQKIEQAAFWLKEQKESRVELIGYSSTSQNITKNSEIAKNRAQAVKSALLTLNIESKRITLKWMPYPPLFSENNSSKARCVKFYWYNDTE